MAKNNTTRVKDKAYVSPDEMIAYLMSKGVSQNHALGIVANVKYESNFNPNSIGDRGTSAGLFQHHAGRKDRLMKYIGNDLSNWRKQVDFMLTEDITQKYLAQDFKTPEKASYWFTTQWERPKNKEQKAVKRQAWIASYKGGKFSNGIYNPDSGETFYKYPGRPEAKYKKDDKGNWLILTPDTGGQFVQIKDPTGSRTKELNNNAIEYYYSPTEDYSLMSPYEAEGLTEAEIEAMGINQDDMMQETDIAAAVQKELEKIREKEKKEQESVARKKLEQLKVEKKKTMIESAFNSAIDAINTLNQKPERNSQIANIGSYQGANIAIQTDLPTLPSLASFEIGGMVGDEEDDFSILNNGNTRVKTRTKKNGDKVTVIFEKLGDGSFKRTKLVTRDGEIIKKRELYGEGSIEAHFDPAGEMGENFREDEEEFVEEEEIADKKKKPSKTSAKSKYGQVFKYENGGTVSSLWEERTGLPWSQAKALGLTDGSYDANTALMEKLKAGQLDIKGGKKPMKQVKTEISEAETFSEAFRIAREQLGPNKMFKWSGRVYGTNLAGEKFEPSEEELTKFNMNDNYTNNRLKKENKELESPYTSKEVVKVEPEWKDWEDIKTSQAEQNKMSQAEKIINYKKKQGGKKNFAIVDKSKGLLHIYNSKGEPLYSTPMNVAVGENEGDAQTTTKYFDLNKDGMITPDEMKRSNVDWDAGNKSTGAGRFFISNLDPTGYKNLPLLNMMNERQHDEYKKTGDINNVSTSFHTGFLTGGDPRASNGCVRCNKPTLDNLMNSLEFESEVFILPEEEGNEFVISNGKLIFKAKDRSKYDLYEDKRGRTQKGQGINTSTSTLNYIPIIPQVDFEKIALNSSDLSLSDMGIEKGEGKSANLQKERITEYAKALADKKRDIMKLTKINGDVYNEIAKMSFGILGTESDYAAKYSDMSNYAKGVSRTLSSGVGGPDYQFEADYREGEGEENYSLGMTQIVWGQLDKEEKKLLENLGVYRPKDLTQPDKAAVATTALLAHRYNNRSFDVDGKKTRINKDNMWELLPKAWNNAENYAERVNNNSQAFSLKQLNDPEKLKQVKDGYKKADAFVKKYITDRGVDVSKPVTNEKDIQKEQSRKKLQAFVDEKPKDSWLGNDPFYEQKRQAYGRAYELEDKDPRYTYAGRPEARYKKDRNGNWMISLPSTRGQFVPIEDPTGSRSKELDRNAKIETFEDGGVYDLTEQEIQMLRDGGYKIEYLD